MLRVNVRPALRAVGLALNGYLHARSREGAFCSLPQGAATVQGQTKVVANNQPSLVSSASTQTPHQRSLSATPFSVSEFIARHRNRRLEVLYIPTSDRKTRTV